MMAVSPCAPLPPRRLFLDFCRSVAVGHRVPAAPFPLFPLPSSLCPAISSCDVCALFPLPPSLCPAISSCDVCAYASRPPPPSLCAPLAPLCPPRPSFALFASSRSAIGPPCAICGGGPDSHDRCVFPLRSPTSSAPILRFRSIGRCGLPCDGGSSAPTSPSFLPSSGNPVVRRLRCCPTSGWSCQLTNPYLLASSITC